MNRTKNVLTGAATALSLLFTPLAAIGLISATPQAAFARTNTQSPKNVIEETWNALKAAHARNPASVPSVLDRYIRRNFDMTSFAASALGIDWRRATNSQKQRFVSAFQKKIKKEYGRKIGAMLDGTIEYRDPQQLRSGARPRISLPTVIDKDGQRTGMAYSMYKNRNGQWKIYDIEIMGISIALHFRRQFGNDIDRAGSLEKFIQDMERETGIRTAATVAIPSQKGPA